MAAAKRSPRKLADVDEDRLRAMGRTRASIYRCSRSPHRDHKPGAPPKAGPPSSAGRSHDRCRRGDRGPIPGTGSTRWPPFPPRNPGAAIRRGQAGHQRAGVFAEVVINRATLRESSWTYPSSSNLLAAIEGTLDVPIYLHPTYPPEQVAEVYFSGLPGQTGRSLGHRGNGGGTQRRGPATCLRLWAAAGVLFARHPNLQDRRQDTWARTCRSRSMARRRGWCLGKGRSPMPLRWPPSSVSMCTSPISGYTTTPSAAVRPSGVRWPTAIMFAADYPIRRQTWEHANVFWRRHRIRPGRPRRKIAYRPTPQQLFSTLIRPYSVGRREERGFACVLATEEGEQGVPGKSLTSPVTTCSC